jgi:protease-4
LLVAGFFLFFVLVLARDGRRGRIGPFALLGGDSVGIVEVEGAITDSKQTIEELKRYERADGVKAIVLRIESPGGGVASAQEIYEEIGKLKKKKPVVASLGGVAASGGYYIASICDTIVANPGTITGSIGVIVQLGNVQDLLQKIGLQGYTIKSGEYKDMGSPLKKLTPESRDIFQDLVNNFHAQFVRAVADGRKMDPKRVERLADGRIYSGEQAKELGLVDVLGNLEDAVQIAAKRAGIKGEPRVVPSSQASKSWWRRLLTEKITEAVQGFLFSVS